MGKKNIKNKFQIFVLVLALILVFCFEVSSIVAVMCAAIIGGIKFLRQKK